MRHRLFLPHIVCFFMISALGHAADKVVVIPLNSAKKLQNIVTVSPKGGDFTDPVAAVNSITDASATNLYLVVIGPGRYNLNASGPLVMKGYVSIAGAGEKATKLYGSRSSDSFNAASAIITGVSNSSLSNLTVENTGGGNYSTAIYNYQASPDLHNIDVIARDSTYTAGMHNENSCYPNIVDVTIDVKSATYGYGMHNVSNGNPFLTNVRSWATYSTISYGIYNQDSGPTMDNVNVRGTGVTYGYGIRNSNVAGYYHPIVKNSKVDGYGGTTGYGIFNVGDGQTELHYSTISGNTYGAYSLLSGTLYAQWSTISGTVFGSALCFGSKQQNWIALDSACQY